MPKTFLLIGRETDSGDTNPGDGNTYDLPGVAPRVKFPHAIELGDLNDHQIANLGDRISAIKDAALAHVGAGLTTGSGASDATVKG